MASKTRRYTNPFLKAKAPLLAPLASAIPNIQDAIALHHQGQTFQAAAIYRKLIEIDPRDAEALHLLGVINSQNGHHQVAFDMIGMAIEIDPNVASYHLNKGIVLQELKQFDAAVVSYDRAIALKADLVEAYYNRGISLQNLKQWNAAVASYDKTIALKPDNVEAHCHRGNALKELMQFESAVTSYERAIALRPDYAEAFYNRGVSQQELKQLENAVASYEQANRLKPDYEYLHGIRQHIKMHMCDWQNFEVNISNLTQKIQNNNKASTGFPVLALPLGLSEKRKVAEIWCGDKHPYNPSLGPILKSARHTRIRIGYYSADFHNHATSYLMAELFELHDKSKFELIAFSFGPDKQDEMRSRVSQAFDRFIDVTSISDKAVAQLSRELGIDIAVDLKGVTHDNRLGIFSYKAAPIQVSYLGYPGTLGADYIDYLIADKTLIPKESQEYYSEKIVYLPNSYQVNDRHRSSRADEGLGATAISIFEWYF